MRFLVLMAGFLGVVGGASAGDSIVEGSDAVAGQFVYEARFGGNAGGFKAPSFQLQFGSERQFLTHTRTPIVAEWRPATQTVLLNGLDLTPMFYMRQEEAGGVGGGIGGALGGWIPLLVILTAATFIAVDGNDLTEEDLFGSGGSGA